MQPEKPFVGYVSARTAVKMGSRENGGKRNENEVSVAKCTLTPFSAFSALQPVQGAVNALATFVQDVSIDHRRAHVFMAE